MTERTDPKGVTVVATYGVLDRLETERYPAMAVRYAPKPGVRRLLLGRSHHHLYVIEEAARVYVVAVWSAYRGRGPLL